MKKNENEEEAKVHLQSVVDNLKFQFDFPLWHSGCITDRYYNLGKELVVSVCKLPRCPQQILMVQDYPRSLNKDEDADLIELLKKHEVYCEVHSVAKLRFQTDVICVFCEIEREL